MSYSYHDLSLFFLSFFLSLAMNQTLETVKNELMHLWSASSVMWTMMDKASEDMGEKKKWENTEFNPHNGCFLFLFLREGRQRLEGPTVD